MAVETFLLGAGASVDAGLPDSCGLTREIVAAFRKAPRLQAECLPVLNFVIGGLAFQRGVDGEDPLERIDVEAVYNALELLARRDDLTITPFVTAWHPRLAELARRHRGRAARHMLDAIRRGLAHGSSSLDEYRFADALEEFLTEREAGSQHILEETCRQMVAALTEIVWIKDPHRAEHLHPICMIAKQQGPTTVATLNYDNSIEVAARTAGIPCTSGIERWSETGRLDVARDGILLLKLHGSLDWEASERHEAPERPLPHITITSKGGEPVYRWGSRPAVIFGQGNKLTLDGPFLEILRRFQEELARTTRLTVVGYSFRDPHVNGCLLQWLNERSDRTVRVIDPGFQESPVVFARQLMRLGSRLEIVPYPAKEGLHQVLQRTA